MVCFKTLSYLFLFGTPLLTSALPGPAAVPSENSGLERRGSHSLVAEPRKPLDLCVSKREVLLEERSRPTPQRVICGPPNDRRVYTLDEINAALSVGARTRFFQNLDYPHAFKNFEQLELYGPGPFYEYPILASGKIFGAPGNMVPGPDRIILDACGRFCGAATHAGMRNNRFQDCVYINLP